MSILYLCAEIVYKICQMTEFKILTHYTKLTRNTKLTQNFKTIPYCINKFKSISKPFIHG